MKEKKPKLNIMVDLETASTKENAAVLSWAMMPFTTDSEECSHEPFYKLVNLTSCFMAGMDIEHSTQKWWLDQTPEARQAVMKSEGESILNVTRAAYCWLSALAEQYDLHIWCRGLDFDLPKTEWCFRKFVEKTVKDIDFPYKYSHKMDVRTVLKFMEIDQSQFEFEGTKHQSLDDCAHDIKMVQEAYKIKNDWMTAAAVKHNEEKLNKLCEWTVKELKPIPLCQLDYDKGFGFSNSQIEIIDKALENAWNIIKDQEKAIQELNQKIKDLQAQG